MIVRSVIAFLAGAAVSVVAAVYGLRRLSDGMLP